MFRKLLFRGILLPMSFQVDGRKVIFHTFAVKSIPLKKIIYGTKMRHHRDRQRGKINTL
jgi:hypothetical protein